MNSNPYLWIAIAVFVVITLVLKGYVKLPSLGKQQANAVHQKAPWADHELDRLDSRTLGVYFANAVRREAEAELAHRIAIKAGDDIKATFQGPFSPAPAGQNNAGTASGA